jgi:hypothetical protein
MHKRFVVVTAAVIAAGALIAPANAAPVVPYAAPQIDSVSPGMGGPGDRIEITGRGFSDAGQPPTVTFLSAPAQVATFSDSAITVVVPTIADPPDGFVELKVATAAGSDSAPFRYYAAPPGELGMPVGLKGTPLKGKVRLTWSPPTKGTDKVTEYQWRFQQRGKAWSPWKKSAKGAEARQQTVKRIRPRQVYVFQVRAMAGTTAGPAATTQVTGK